MGDPARAPGSVTEFTKRYNMSVSEAKGVLCPCGYDKGKRMGALNFRSIYWFATRKTTTKNSPEFLKAVKAACIIRAAHFAEQARDKYADRLANASMLDDDAKHITAICRECGAMMRISRRILDQRNPSCAGCGGQLDINDTSVVDEWITLKEAARLAGRSTTIVRHWIDNDEVMARKIRGRWYIGKSSFERTASIKKRDDELAGHMPFGDFQKGHICPHCKKVFRNFGALKMHIKERHEEF